MARNDSMSNKEPWHATLAAILLTLLLGVCGTVTFAAERGGNDYPNGRFLISAGQLQAMKGSNGVVIVDVRPDKDFDGRLIPGAVHMPWTLFTKVDQARNMGGVFVGTDKAQEIFGQHGLTRGDMVVLYDSVASDGGATASYVFWVLDLLGHSKMALLDRGIDGWADGGHPVTDRPAKPEPRAYLAPKDEIRPRRLADEGFIMDHLRDPGFQILDVRSREEYLGRKINTAMDGTPLRPGHIPGSLNVNYKFNWTDEQVKAIKPYAELRELYLNLDPSEPVAVYCHSGRRSSFSYYILRLMGFSDVILYDNSWMGWGQPTAPYPVEMDETKPGSESLSGMPAWLPPSSKAGDSSGHGAPGHVPQ